MYYVLGEVGSPCTALQRSQGQVTKHSPLTRPGFVLVLTLSLEPRAILVFPSEEVLHEGIKAASQVQRAGPPASAPPVSPLLWNARAWCPAEPSCTGGAGTWAEMEEGLCRVG